MNLIICLVAASIITAGTWYIIKLIRILEKDIPNMSVKLITFIFIVSFFSMVFARNKYILMVSMPFLTYSLVSAYTDYHTKKLYDVISVTAFIIGSIFLLEKDWKLYIGFLPVVIIVVMLWISGCCAVGDVLLLLASYPYVTVISDCTNVLSSILIFLGIIFIGNFLCVVKNIPKLMQNIKYKSAYAPYHLVAIIIFFVVS